MNVILIMIQLQIISTT